MTAYCQTADLSASETLFSAQSHLSDRITESPLCFMRSTKSVEHRVSVSVLLILIISSDNNLDSLSSWPAPLLYLLVLTPHGEPVDVHGDGDHDFGIPHRFP